MEIALWPSTLDPRLSVLMDDDSEYELEPPDADVLAAEERRAKAAIEATRRSIDIDEIYREDSRDRGGEILQEWTRNLKFRFQVKHLLIGTAVLAIALTLWRWGILGTTLVILMMLSIAGLYLYLQWQEKKQRDEADRRRREMYARRRAPIVDRPGTDVEDGDEMPAEPVPAPPVLPNETDEVWQDSMAQEKFRIHFSLREMMLAMTAAAVMLCLIRVLGGAANTATLLGFIALIGLVVHALGFDPPEIVILGWWLILVLYVLLSIVAAMWTGFA
jgi:uncharacterized membrane protein YecN with MAPEG domain